MLRLLVERLPAMLSPAWTATRMQPIALDDVVALLRFVLGRAGASARTTTSAPGRAQLPRAARLTGSLLGHRARCSPCPSSR
ncbi:MAG: hypothetical protein IPF99_37650 [Deltaproteobacteria bacterium]|nr:hypothetical protein [Deltaproteobacteria bacterium]